MCICYGHARSCPLDEITKVFFNLINLFSQNNFSDLKKKTLPKLNESEEAERGIQYGAHKLFSIIFFLVYANTSGSLT